MSIRNLAWHNLSDQEQIYLYWEYNASLPENEQISFSEFDEIMQEYDNVFFLE